MKHMTIPQTPLVSIITVNYLQDEATFDFLRSVRSLRYPNLEVIVVNNSAPKGNPRQFGKHYPGVKVINSGKNLGFAAGNNLGIKEAAGDYLFFINNDTVVENGLVESLLARLQQKGVGAVSPKIRYFSKPDIIQYAGFTKINSLTGRNTATGKGERDTGQYDKPRQVPYAHGCAMMLRREVIEKVGLMPEEFFLYYEEMDWCEKIRKAGYTIWYEPAGAVLHKESISTGKDSPLKTEYLTRNRILFMRRNFGPFKLAMFLVFLLTVTVPVWTARWLKLGRTANLKAFYKGIFKSLSYPLSGNRLP